MALFDLVFVVGVKYKVKILFSLDNFCRDALISFHSKFVVSGCLSG